MDLQFPVSTKVANARVGHTAHPSRGERNKRDKLARIKSAAHKLFSRKGFDATTTRAIAQAADIGTGTLFLYVGSKEDLLVLIFREEMELVVNDAFATMPNRALRDQVLHVFNAMIAYHEQDPGLARVFVKELPFVDDRRHGVAELMTMLFAGLANLIEQAKSRGEIKTEVPAKRLAQNLFALYIAELQQWLGREPVGPQKRDDALRSAIELQLEGLRNADFRQSMSRNASPLPEQSSPLPQKDAARENADERTNWKRVSRRAR